MRTWARAIVTYVPGAILILFGAGATVVIPFMSIAMELAIGDGIRFESSEGIEARGGQLGPWRPATTEDLKSKSRICLPVQRYIIRDGWVNAALQHVELTIARDKDREIPDTVIRLDPHCRFGYAVPAVLLCTAGPIGLGILWLRIMRRLLPPDQASARPQASVV